MDRFGSVIERTAPGIPGGRLPGRNSDRTRRPARDAQRWHHQTVSIELYPFRFRDRLTGHWVRARYRATRTDIAARYAEWEVTGPPELREPLNTAFTPFVRPAVK
jgi:hypothetical protein